MRSSRSGAWRVTFARDGRCYCWRARRPRAQVDTGHHSRHGEGSVGRRAARRHGHHHPRRPGLHAVRRDARGRHLHLHADPHRRLHGRSRVPGLPEDACGAASPSASSSRRSSTSRSSPAPSPRRSSSPPTRRCSRPAPARSARRSSPSTIENLPINGRDYTILARLTAGVVPPQPGARAPLMFSANGVRPAQNNYLLDGIDNNTSNVDFLSGVAYIVKPPVDAVDEIKILTSSFSAEYGRAGGAVLNTTLKSGTNQLRGSVWEFDRNDALNATDFFANRAGLKKGEYLSNQFGFTAGGPVIGSKTFWFADYEGSLIKQARTWVTTVPTAAAARQRLHQLLRPDRAAERHGRRRHPRPHASRAARSSIRRRRGSCSRARSIRSPAWRRRAPASCATRSPATGFRPAGSNANALRLMQLYPEPNSAGSEQQLRRQPHQHRRHALVRRPRRSQLQRQRSLLRALQLLGQPQGAAVAVRRRRRRRRVQRRRREGARQRLRGQPHAHVLADADQRGALRPEPRAHQPAAAERRRHQRPAGHATASSAFRRWPATAACRRCVSSGLTQLGHDGWVVSERFSNTRAVQRQPDEGVQVAHLQGRLHVPGHLLRLDAAAVRARRVLLGRPLHVAGQPDRQQHGARALPAVADPVARAGRRRLPGRHERHPRLAVRRRRRVQDLSRRLRAGQLARLVRS